MYEVEMKFRADHERVRRVLDERGANERNAVRQRDTYYNAPMRDFDETDEALRVRQEGGNGRARITYKGPLVGESSKTRQEHETELGNGNTMDSILGALGFVPVATVEKERERFSLGEYVVTLDSVDELGEFVEVETEAEEGGLDAAREGVTGTVESLGMDPAEEIRTSYLELLLGNAQ